MRCAVPTLALLMTLAGATRLYAGTITLKTQLTSAYTDNGIELQVKTTNVGDAPAHDLLVEAVLGDVSTIGRQPTLRPGGTFNAELDLGAAPQPPGIHTVVVYLRYVDAGGHPSTSVQSVPVVSPHIDRDLNHTYAKLQATEAQDHAELTLHLESQTGSAVDAAVSLLLPDEIGCENSLRQRVTIPATGSTALSFTLGDVHSHTVIRNRVGVMIDSVYDGYHGSTVLWVPLTIEASHHHHLTLHHLGLLLLLLVAGAAFILAQFPRSAPWVRFLDLGGHPLIQRVFPASVLVVLMLFINAHVPVSFLFQDTVLTGGDTPAHNYLASHLAETLFGHGRIIAWANGWWAGFPMFQYYFCLPYLLAALLDLVLPFNIALKLVSVVGIYGLPFATYAAARHLKAPRPVPTLAAIAAVLQLCDTSHTMWGVNCYSTLAGMIANSISFPIMLLFIAHATRDAAESRYRIRTVLLLAALLASHFFTSLMAILMLAIVPLLQPRRRILPALGVLVAEGLTAALLMAWWLIPLIAKSAYAVDFGLNWDVDILRQMPPQIVLLAPLIIVAIVLGIRRQIILVPLATSMFVTAAVLFLIGFTISEVFVNVRLWPFMTFSLLLLGATGLGLLLANRRAPELGVAIALLAALTYGIQNDNDIVNWSRWNYSGMEAKPNWKVFEALVLPLKGTPGRLANDLHSENDSMGSSRVFESVPHLIGKPILEGGIVNSAEGALFAYYIQSETSDNCAGFPPIVKPTTFDFGTATRHLELFNVKHFIARSDQTQKALADAPEWEHLRTSADWELYELTTHDGHYTFVPECHPVGVKTEQWKTLGLEWIYAPEALDSPFALLPHGETDFPGEIITETEFAAALQAPNPQPTAAPPNPIVQEEVTDLRIRFTTCAVGLPHIIKINHFPNWKVRGARGVYRITPGFMLVYPEQPEVELYYGYVLPDILGIAFSWLGLIILIVAGWGARCSWTANAFSKRSTPTLAPGSAALPRP
jgi:hypothetical protein